MARKSLLKSIVGAIVLSTVVTASAATAVATHGKLSTSGGYVLDQNGKIVQLRGISFYWATPSWPGYKYYDAATVDALVDIWHCTVVRAAYDPTNTSGWDGVKKVIDEAIVKGIYVIIDWHSHTAETQESAAVSFFTTQAQNYKNTPNVIFEPYNEPKLAGGATDGSLTSAQMTWKAIKPYLADVTKAIRGAGADNLVILGTPYFDQFVNVAASDQVKDASGNIFKNVAYAFHFYAASHGPEAYYVKNGPDAGKGGLEASYLAGALGKIPIFITEWGTTHSDGGEGGTHTYIDETNTNWWFSKYVNDDYHLSTCAWSASDFQLSSCFSGNASTPSTSGAIVKRLLTASTIDSYDTPAANGYDGPSKDSVFSMEVPGTHAAASYNRYFGNVVSSAVGYTSWDKVDKRIADNSSIKVPAGVATDWVSYNVKTTAATSYIKVRCLPTDGSGTIDVYSDNAKVGTISVAKNSTWATVVAPVTIAAGSHVLKFVFTNATSSGYYMEWFELSNNSSVVRALQHTLNTKASANMTLIKNGIIVSLPLSHGYTSYTLIGADGRKVKSGALNSAMSEVKFDNLSKGTWLIKLDGIYGAKHFKAVLAGL